MADSERSGGGAEGAAPPPATRNVSSLTAVDNSTDVAPTRRARRRAERRPEAKGAQRKEQQEVKEEKKKEIKKEKEGEEEKEVEKKEEVEKKKEEEKEVEKKEEVEKEKEDEEEEKQQVENKKEEEKKEALEARPDSSVTPSGWGYWGSWGKTILSTATATVTTVGQGLTQVLEKAETSLGIPSPADLCEEQHKEEASPTGAVLAGSKEAGETSGGGAPSVGGAMGMLSSLSSVVHSTGTMVIGGGLDALEFIGKKTMDVIAEGDPGFRRTKGLMNRNATLSQVLREAKEREQQLHTEERSSAHKKVLAHYGTFFDEFQGLSHLEALEILSRESEAKVSSVLHTVSGDQQQQLRDQMDSMKEAFTLVEFDEEDVDERGDDDGSQFEEELLRVIHGLSVSTAALKLSTACRGAYTHICSITDPKAGEGGDGEAGKPPAEEIHVAAIRSLAELTARSIQLFHKLAESSLLSGGCAEPGVLSQLTVLLCQEVSRLSRRFTSCLTAAGAQEKADVLNPLITAVFLEASNSASYIQDAFQLLLPVLQISHIQSRATV